MSLFQIHALQNCLRVEMEKLMVLQQHGEHDALPFCENLLLKNFQLPFLRKEFTVLVVAVPEMFGRQDIAVCRDLTGKTAELRLEFAGNHDFHQIPDPVALLRRNVVPQIGFQDRFRQQMKTRSRAVPVRQIFHGGA